MRILIVGALVLLGYAVQDETAGKRRLGQLGYPFTEDAFEHAIVDGNKEAVRLFLQLGMDANHRFERGGPALGMAAAWCRREPEEDRFDIMQALLDAKPTIDAKAQHDVTPLMNAVRANCPVKFVEALVRAGANVNVKTKTGFSLLSMAEQRGNEDVANVLRKAGAR
jgi:ankyrin repeat protein